MSKQETLEGLESAVGRDPLDFNRTPAWVVELLVPHLGEPRTVVDVGCGDGAIGRVLRQAWPRIQLHGIEVHAARARECSGTYTVTEIGDWFGPLYEVGYPRWADLIISNPPFGLLALRFLARALERVAPGGTVAFLLPTHWDQEVDSRCGKPIKAKRGQRPTELDRLRASLPQYARHRFLDGLRLPCGTEGYGKLSIVGRPSFRGGAQGPDRYAWFVFGPGWAGVHRRLRAIPPVADDGQMVIGGT